MKDNFVKYQPNPNGRDFVSSDIHGCFADLEEQLDQLNFDESADRLFCVGDLIDRGPESERCVEFLDKPWFYSIMGNHEELAISGFSGGQNPYGYSNERVHKVNGGHWLYTLPSSEASSIVSRLRDLPVLMQVGEYGLVHAEIDSSVRTWEEAVQRAKDQNISFIDSALWGRLNLKYGIPHTVNGIKKVFAGHTIVEEPRLLGNIHYIDTGSFQKYSEGKNGHITVLELEHE